MGGILIQGRIEETNCITREIDKHLNFNDKHKIHTSYLYAPKKYIENGETLLPFRSPGATRGHIEIDSDNIIKNIKFYDCGWDIYKPSVKIIKDKFIGYNFILKED